MASRSRRPYIIRAIYQWAVDNGYTPHIVVAADYPGVSVPRQHVQEGRIILNIAMMAVQNLDLESDPIWFSARFSGHAFDVIVPSGAVLAIFARETGEGHVFGEAEPQPAQAEGETAAAPAVKPVEGSDKPAPPSGDKPKGGGRTHLRVVK